MVANKRETSAVEPPATELHFITWGGGGWGDPLQRDPALVAKEVWQGLVTAEGAKAYGVVTDAAGKLDDTATAALRARLQGECTGDLPLFDYGPSIESLRRTSLVDTGLPAPKSPSERGFGHLPQALAAE